MAKPKSRPQLSMLQARYLDDLGGIPVGHWCYRFFDNVLMSFRDDDFAHLYREGGRYPISPRLLICICILQYMHGVSDRQAVEQTIASRYWRIALGIEPGYEGFDHSVLCRFRQGLLKGKSERLVFDRVLARVRELKLIDKHHRVRVDSTALLANVALLNRADLLRESIRLVVRDLSRARPELESDLLFLRWCEQYGEETWLGGQRVTDAKLVELARDAKLVLQLWGERPGKHRDILARVLDENFVFPDEGTDPVPKAPDDLPADHIVSPHDPDVEVGKKGNYLWNGDKIHITETVAPGDTGFLVDVTTTGPRVPDANMLADLAQRVGFLAPQVDALIADSGYSSAANTLEAGKVGLDLISPPRVNNTRGIFPAGKFIYDFKSRTAICPAGQQSRCWYEAGNRTRIKFSAPVCRACALRSQCTTSANDQRTLTLPLNLEQLHLDRRRAQEDEFTNLYTQRAGIEATISELVRCCHMRRSRYRGFARRQLHVLLAATALNVRRLLRCLEGQSRRVAGSSCAFLRILKGSLRALLGGAEPLPVAT